LESGKEIKSVDLGLVGIVGGGCVVCVWVVLVVGFVGGGWCGLWGGVGVGGGFGWVGGGVGGCVVVGGVWLWVCGFLEGVLGVVCVVGGCMWCFGGWLGVFWGKVHPPRCVVGGVGVGSGRLQDYSYSHFEREHRRLPRGDSQGLILQVPKS